MMTYKRFDFINFICDMYEVSEEERNINIKTYADILELSDNLGDEISSFSHGMKQKLCLIASLMGNPDIWILDEPTVGLDIMAVDELIKMMKEYAAHGKTVFITSHNIDLVSKICDRVAIINDGVVVDVYDLNKNPNYRLQLSRLFLNIFGEK